MKEYQVNDQNFVKAYKFKAAAQLEHVLEIINEDRLYCADWQELNDPMEGVFQYFWTDENFAHKLMDSKQKKRVCSLASCSKNILLWSHYASGFNGLAIEVELAKEDVKEVSYKSHVPDISNEQELKHQEIVEMVLYSKLKAWEYEKELRIIHGSEHYPLPRSVSKIIIGSRMEIDQVEQLKNACRKKEIPMFKVVIELNGTINYERILY